MRPHAAGHRRLVDPHAQPQFEPIVRLIAIKDGRIKGVAHPGEHEAIIEQVLWEGVQAKLSTPGSKQRKKAAPCLWACSLTIGATGCLRPTPPTRAAATAPGVKI